MQVHLNREAFASAFSVAASVAPRRSPKEILTNVKMVVSGGSVVLSATDMEISIRTKLESAESIVREGATLLPVQRMSAILSESTDEVIEIESDDSGIIVRGKQSRFRLPSANPDEFPTVAEFTSKQFHLVDARTLKTAFQRTMFATDTESSRYALGGVLLEMEGQSFIAIGTDGRRLACVQSSGEAVEGHATVGLTTIVPAVASRLIERSLQPKDGLVRVAVSVNDVMIESDRCVIFARLVEGRYPNWRQVFPKTERDSVQVEIPAGVLGSAIRRAAICTDAESRGIDFALKKGTLQLSAHAADVGSSDIETPVAYDDRDVNATLDYRYIADFAKVVDAEDLITLDIESSSQPVVLSIGDEYRYVIMPMAKDR